MINLQRRYMPSTTTLQIFEAASRHQSFTLAAAELSLSQSAISKQIKELEHIVGAGLFRRTGREVILTPAGRRLAADVTVELDNIRRIMLRAVSAGNMSSTLQIATLPTFASLWLIPRLPTFFKAHPDLEVNFTTRFKPFDLTSENFDLAIHFGQKNWPNTKMRKFLSERMIPVCSPQFSTDYGSNALIETPGAPLLHTSSRPSAWPDYLEQEGLSKHAHLSGRYFDQFSMVIAAVNASLGIGLLPDYLVKRESMDGSLIVMSGSHLKTSNSYYFVTPRNQENESVEKFYSWIVDQATQTIPCF